jgi:acyl phosphate:glycerol-3-phosphate acyltransferase
MGSPLAWGISCAAGFLLGSIPVGLWWGRIFRGIDVRCHGSGNLGATNVYRVLGPAHGIAVFLLDVAKGGGAVLVAHRVAGQESIDVLAGLLAVLGHMFTPWAGFRGGKGVATGLGIWLLLAPVPSLIALAVWGGCIALTRRVSAASLGASAALVPLVFQFGGGRGTLLPSLAAVTAVLVWIRHRANIRRLLGGQEPPLWGKGS